MSLLKDNVIGNMIKLGVLIVELIITIIIISLSAMNPIFNCNIIGCTYDVLPPVVAQDQLEQTWDPMSGKAVTSLLYFTLGIALLPLILWHIYGYASILYKAAADYDSDTNNNNNDTLAYGEERESRNTGIDDKMNVHVQENPMMKRVGTEGGNDDGKGKGLEMSRMSLSRISTPSKQSHNSNASDNNSNTIDSASIIYAHKHRIESTKFYWTIGILLCLLLLFPIHYFFTTRLGNDFQWFSDYGNAAWAKHIIHPNIPVITISKLLNYKFFPQIIIFYIYIYIIVIVALLAKLIPSLRSFFASRPPIFQFLSILDRCTMGEFLMAVNFGIFTFATFAYTFWNWYSIPHVKWLGSPQTERWGRCLGQTSLFPMGAMILPINRNSVWGKLLDYPWDGMVKFHKWMSITFLLISTGHMIAFWFCFNTLNIFPNALFSSPNTYRDVDSTIAMMSGLILFVILPVFGIFTWNYIRRNYFELFYYTHFTSSILFMATLWHADFAWMYLVPGLTMYLIDYMLRFTDNIKNYEIIGLEPCGDDIVELAFVINNPNTNTNTSISSTVVNSAKEEAKLHPLTFESGQYVFINIPELSPLQSHPFNISGSMYDTSTIIHIKSCGEHSWTGQLLALAKKIKLQNDNYNGNSKVNSSLFPLKRLAISVDGPYGTPFPYPRCSTILLVGGGIGVTPLHSILRSLIHICRSDAAVTASNNMPSSTKTKTRTTDRSMPKDSILTKVKLIWTYKNHELITCNRVFKDTLFMLSGASVDVDVDVDVGSSHMNAARISTPIPLSREHTPVAKHNNSYSSSDNAAATFSDSVSNMSPSPKSKSQVAPSAVPESVFLDSNSVDGEDLTDDDEDDDEVSIGYGEGNIQKRKKNKMKKGAQSVAPAGLSNTNTNINIGANPAASASASASADESRKRLEANGFSTDTGTPVRSNVTSTSKRHGHGYASPQGMSGSGSSLKIGNVTFEVSLYCTGTGSKEIGKSQSTNNNMRKTSTIKDSSNSDNGNIINIAMTHEHVQNYDIEGGTGTDTGTGTSPVITEIPFSYPVVLARPELVKEISALSGNRDALCFCVGPDSLVSKTREICSDLNVEFRGECAEL
jgi:predicted ferric reductase